MGSRDDDIAIDPALFEPTASTSRLPHPSPPRQTAAAPATASTPPVYQPQQGTFSAPSSFADSLQGNNLFNYDGPPAEVTAFDNHFPHPPGGSQPRLSHARPAVPNDPTIRPYGCNSPACTPPPSVIEARQDQYERDRAAWRAAMAKRAQNPSASLPFPRHPSLESIGTCFSASRDLLDHLRDVHQMRQKGEVHVSQLPTTSDSQANLPNDLAEDGKMFRCALVGCQRTWKNANGLQYHCLTSLTADEHNIDTVNRRRAPPKRKAEDVEPVSPDVQLYTCPYRDKLKCSRVYRQEAAVRQHLEQSHANEPDYQVLLARFPSSGPATAKPTQKKQKTDTNPPSATKPTAAAPKSNVPVQAKPASGPSSSVPRFNPPIPHTGVFTHGYLFSPAHIPFRPRRRPVDALYYLNLLQLTGTKTSQQRNSERLLVNALLSAGFIKYVQDEANKDGSLKVDVVDQFGLAKAPKKPITTEVRNDNLAFGKQDIDSAILKLAKTLQEVGFGNAV